jgi:hypothetical protein
MQLFTIGLNWLNNDGTPLLDQDGRMIRTYTNRDISEYAKIYVGLGLQQWRGNIDGANNQVDPLAIQKGGLYKDHLPKVCCQNRFDHSFEICDRASNFNEISFPLLGILCLFDSLESTANISAMDILYAQIFPTNIS